MYHFHGSHSKYGSDNVESLWISRGYVFFILLNAIGGTKLKK